MALEPIEVGDGALAYDPAWIDAATGHDLHARLVAQLPWSRHHVRLFGRELPAPRLSCWVGDADASYRYSGVLHAPQPWCPALTALRVRLQAALGLSFNSVLANRYRDGRDSMGWHSDDERALGPRPAIASISLGAPRRFVLRHRRQAGRKRELVLEHGSLLLMHGELQQHWQHALPRTARPVGERLNLTFRLVQPGA